MKALCKFWLILMVLTPVAACIEKTENVSADRVVLQLKWIHQAQFAGFYTAHEKGYYDNENIAVEFIEGGNEVDLLANLVAGHAQFAVAAPDLVMIQRQVKTSPITAVAAIYRKSAVVYAAKQGSGISQPIDCIGKKAAVASSAVRAHEFELQFKALMAKQGIDVSRISLLPYDPTYKGFFSGDVEITAAYYTSGVMRIRDNGHKINLIWPSDYGIHFYSDILATTEQMIAQKPELVERFVRASLKGWQYAIGQPEEAVAFTMKFAKIKDAKVQSGMFNALTPLVHTGNNHIGWMKADDWEHMHQVLVNQKILDRPLKDLEKAFDLQFLKRIYPSK